MTVDFQKACYSDIKERNGRRESMGWSTPPEGWYKLNCDVAVFNRELSGFGRIIRDCVGDVIVSFSDVFKGELRVEEAEARAALMGLEIAWDIGIRRVTLELDCLAVVNVLCNK